MKRAHDALYDLSRDPDAQRIALQRERNERASRHMFGSALQAGIEIGRGEGIEIGRGEGIEIGRGEGLEKARVARATSLARLAAKRFGPLTDAQRARIEAADAATLDGAFERLLDVDGIDALFDR